MFRGSTGIQKDTADQAKILGDKYEANFNMALNPNSFISIQKLLCNKLESNNVLINGLSQIEPKVGFFGNLFKGISMIVESIRNLFELTPIQLSEQLLNRSFFLQFNLELKSRPGIYILPLNFKSRYFMSLLRSPAKLKTENFDIFIQQSLLPIRVSKNTKHIIRLHDLIPITHTNFFESRVRLLYRNAIFLAEKKDDIIWVLPTKATELEFQKIFGKEKKTYVVFNSIRSHYSGKFENKEKLILVLGTIQPRKNIKAAIESFEFARSRGLINNEWKLIVAGGYGWDERELYRSLKLNLYGDHIIFCEAPTESEVANLLERASILLCVSEKEGFSRTPLEGMMYGCIPVVSDIPQHRETIGELGQYLIGEETCLVAEALCRGIAVSDSANFDFRNRLRSHVCSNFSEAIIAEQWKSLFNTW